jgi:hypothetical protein
MAKDSAGGKKGQFAEVVAEWQQHLLQLNRRNNLLYFRPGKTAVRIAEHKPDIIMRSLLDSRRGLTFDYAERRTRRVDLFPEATTDDGEEPEPYVVAGDLRGDCPPLELQRRLGNLRRRAREWEEEQGLNILFLAIGILRWVDEDGEKASAPLLLLPCHLGKAAPREAFTLAQNDEDLAANPTLIVKLQDFGITLPEVDSGLENPSEYLDVVRRLVRRRPEWEVHEDVYLATFAYSKLAMWRDLEIIKVNGTDHPIVNALTSGEQTVHKDTEQSAYSASVSGDLAGGRLDDVLNVRDQFAVLPADYSQLLAISSAKSGANLVMHGPPGTGKSQTIANIIATFFAEGKSVLFVSEKTAALDVVKRRLDEKQLGVFCLDLHSERGSKSNVYEQLRKSVDDRKAVSRLDFDYAALEERRSHLNKVVRALHQTRVPLGYTAYQVEGRFSENRSAPHVPFELGGIGTLDRTRLAEIMSAAGRLRLRRREFREHWTSHWKVLKGGTPSIGLAEKIRSDMRIVAAATLDLRGSGTVLSGSLGLKQPSMLQEFGVLEAVASHFATAPGVPRGWLKDGVPDRLRRIANQEASTQSARNALIARLTGVFGTPAPTWNFDGLLQELEVGEEESRSLNIVLGASWGERVIRVGGITSLSLRRLSAAIAEMISLCSEAGDYLRSIHDGTWRSSLDLMDVVQSIGKVASVPERWVEPKGTDAVTDALDRARKTAKDLEEQEKALFSEFEPGILDTVNHDMLIRYRTDYQNRLRRLVNSKYRSDRKAIQALRLSSGKKMPFSRQLQVIEQAQELKGRMGTWGDMEPDLLSALGIRCAGRSTDWSRVETDIRIVRGLLSRRDINGTQIAQLLTDERCSDHCVELTERFVRVVVEIQQMMDVHLDGDLSKQVRENKVTLSFLEEWVSAAAAIAARIERAADSPMALGRQNIRDLPSLRDVIHSGAELRELEGRHFHEVEKLQADFGSAFSGFATDWPGVVASLEWTEGLLALVPDAERNLPLLDHTAHPKASSYYKQIVEAVAESIRKFESE